MPDYVVVRAAVLLTVFSAALVLVDTLNRLWLKAGLQGLIVLGCLMVVTHRGTVATWVREATMTTLGVFLGLSLIITLLLVAQTLAAGELTR